MNKVVLYCRPGFEKECAAEITDKAAKREVFGFARVKENAGYVVFECYQPDDADKLARELPPHVTLIGSSGAGPIAPDTPVEALRAAIEPVTRATPPLDLTFGAPQRFIGREIVVLPFFFGPSKALTGYLPERMAALQARFPDVTVRVARPSASRKCR